MASHVFVTGDKTDAVLDEVAEWQNRRKRWGGRPHSTASRCQNGHWSQVRKEASIEKISIIGLDLAKNTIQLHASDRNGAVLVRKKLPRNKVLPYLNALDPCIVAMEA